MKPHVLKVCPFCRDRAASVEGDAPRIYVECHGCGARGPDADTELEAIARWNREPREGE
jgi:Lar family restriction alleviation protein